MCACIMQRLKVLACFRGQDNSTSRSVRRTRPGVTVCEAVYEDRPPEHYAIHSSDHQSPHRSHIPSDRRTIAQADPERMAIALCIVRHFSWRHSSRFCLCSTNTDVQMTGTHLQLPRCRPIAVQVRWSRSSATLC